MLRCKACKTRFSERKGTPLFDSRLPPEKVESVLEHIAEVCGVRQAGRLCKVDRGTVGRLSRIASDHSHDLHDECELFSVMVRKTRNEIVPMVRSRFIRVDRWRLRAEAHPRTWGEIIR